MTSGKIRVCILEGHQAELASAGLPLSVCLRLQELGLSMSAAQWSTRQTNSRFSVSIFWPSSTNVRGGTTVGQQKPRSRKRRRRKRKRAQLNASAVSVVRDVSPAQDPQNPRSAAASPINAHQPSLSPPPLAATDSSKLPSTTPTKMPNSTDSADRGTLNTSNSSISSGSTEAEESSMSPSSAEGSGWTVVSPRRRFRGPRVPAPYFRMPSHLWPPEIQKKYLQTTPSSSPVASRTRAKTSTT